MKIRSLLALAGLLAALVSAAPAAAQSLAYVVSAGYTNMRAGPDTSYPVVAKLVPGSQFHVLGCLSNHSWCEGVVQGVRGWVHSNRLEFLYAGRRVLVPHYYSYFGAPIVSFRFGGHHHHANRPWRPGWDNPDRPRDPNRLVGTRRGGGGGGGTVWNNPGGGGGGDRPRNGRGGAFCARENPLC